MSVSNDGGPTEPESFAAGRMTESAAKEQFAPMLDQQATVDIVRELRGWCREQLRLRPGDTVVDVGSGTGEELAVLAELVAPGGSAIGIDANEPLLGVARERIGHRPGVQLVAAEAADLRSVLADDSVRGIVCERVIQHLQHDPVDAFREFARVLRPDGTLAVTDTDWSSLHITVDDDPAATDFLIELVGRISAPSAGDRRAGLHLEDYSRAAGLSVAAHRTGVLELPRTMMDGAQTGMATLAGSVFSPTELAEARRILADAIRSDRLHVNVTLHAVIARPHGTTTS
jgi:ubiquinone/menaquinone biosynthesis C-methylase UbiE